MAGSAACWGFGTVASRHLLGSIPAAELLVVQLTASVAALASVCWWRGTWRAADRRLVRASLPGILEPGAAYAVGLVGLSYTTAGNAAIIGATEPLAVVLLLWLIHNQAPSRRLVVCLAVATAGLILVSRVEGTSSPAASVTGDLLMLAATVLAALYVVASSRFAPMLPASALAAGQQSVGLLVAASVYLVVAGHRGSPMQMSTDAAILGYAALSGVIQYALAFGLYLVGLRHLSTSVAALWLAMIPVFGVAGAFVFLGERPGLGTLIGAALIVGAIVSARNDPGPLTR